MTWSIEWSKDALRALRGIDHAQQKRIVERVEQYATTGHGDVKALQGEAAFRLRVGDDRVMFERDGDRLVVLVLDVAHRREAYR